MRGTLGADKRQDVIVDDRISACIAVLARRTGESKVKDGQGERLVVLKVHVLRMVRTNKASVPEAVAPVQSL